jgi:hypothetical protein
MMQTMRNIQTFKDEKVSGRFKRGLIYGNGLTDKTFDQAMSRSEQISENKGFTVYNEIPVLLSMLPDMKLHMLDLASLPDGFDWEKEVNLYVYILALVLCNRRTRVLARNRQRRNKGRCYRAAHEGTGQGYRGYY